MIYLCMMFVLLRVSREYHSKGRVIGRLLQCLRGYSFVIPSTKNLNKNNQVQMYHRTIVVSRSHFQYNIKMEKRHPSSLSIVSFLSGSVVLTYNAFKVKPTNKHLIFGCLLYNIGTFSWSYNMRHCILKDISSSIQKLCK